MAVWVWAGVGVLVVLGLLAAARADRRAKQRGHLLRGAGAMSKGLRTSKAAARVRERTYQATPTDPPDGDRT